MNNKLKFACTLANELYLSILICWSLAFCLFFVQSAYSKNFFATRWTDFCKFYAAGKVLSSGQNTNLYNPYFQRRYLAELVAPTVPPPVEEVDGKPAWEPMAEQPPFFLAIYWPLSYLRPADAFVLSTFAYLILGVGSLIYLTRSTKTLSTVQTLILALGAIASGPSCWAFVLGQPTWLLIALFSLMAASWLKSNDRLSGAFFAASAIKPQYALFLGASALAERKWTLLAASLFSGLCLALLSVVICGWANVINYLPLISKIAASHRYAVADATMPSLRGLLTVTIGNQAAIPLSTFFALASVLLLFLFWWRTKEKNKDRRIAFAVTFITMLFFNPHTFRYDTLLLIIPAALTLRSLNVFKAEGTLAYRVWQAAFVCAPAASLLLHLSSAGEEVKTGAMALFLAFLLVLALIQWQGSGQEPGLALP